MKTYMFAKRAALALAMTGMMLTTSLAHAGSKGGHGKLKLTENTEIGGVVLGPGEYEVKVQNTATGPVMQFGHWTEDPYPKEGWSPYDFQVDATVKVLPQGTAAAIQRTSLLADGDAARPIGVAIRGDNLDYLFVTDTGAALRAQNAGQ